MRWVNARGAGAKGWAVQLTAWFVIEDGRHGGVRGAA